MSAGNDYPGVYIDGAWAQTDEREAVINPATEAPIASAPVGTAQHAEAAIASARRAFDEGPWPRLSPDERCDRLEAFQQAIEARADEIQALVTAESGATAMLSAALHYAMPLRFLELYARLGRRDPIVPSLIATGARPDGGRALGAGMRIYEPVGVVGAITPFNFPHFLNVMKVAPALAAGNCVVLKPSPYTPLEALLLGEIANEIDLPPGVLNVITGDAKVGEMLTTDPRVVMVSFTGSDVVGARVMAQGAPSLKRVLLELGGKSAMVVCEDADLPRLLPNALEFTIQAGQGCAITTRHLVHNSVRDRYVQMLGAAVEAMQVGDPADPGVHMGPLIREAQRERIEEYVADGLACGGRLVAGGRRPDALDRGFFYRPTVLDGVDNRWRVAQEEIFGPVAVVIGFDSDEEAIEIANDSKFGLGGAVFSADPGRAFEIARAMRTGTVSINGGADHMPKLPFGGYKRSGIGREMGIEGLNEYCQINTVSFPAG